MLTLTGPVSGLIQPLYLLKPMSNNKTYDPSNTVLSKVLYNVHTADAAMFQAVVGSNDSPDYSAVASEANVECVKLSPLAESNVVT